MIKQNMKGEFCNSDCCSWNGVTCDQSTGHVIGLDVISSQLIAKSMSTVASSFFIISVASILLVMISCFLKSHQFAKLIHLNLSSSNFSGLVPSEISHLSKLGSRDLSDNNVGHGLEIGQHCFNKILQNLTEVRYLLLDNVNMSPVVPSSLVNFSSFLISLSLSNTQLRHEFLNGVFRLPFLQYLSLSRNGGLIGNLLESNWSSPLRLLDLSSTKFSGILPEKIENLIHLNMLDLSYCKFTDSNPGSLWNLTSITILDLTFNNFTGQVPTLLSNLRKPTRLSFVHNSFFGQFLDVLGNLSKVIEIYLFDNNFSGQLPLSAFNLTQIGKASKFLDLHSNLLQGPLLLLPLSRKCFSVSNNKLTGETPSWTCGSGTIEYLNLSRRSLQCLGNHDKIFLLDLTMNRALTTLNLNSNPLEGTLPQSLAKCSSLEVPDVGNNKINDKFPHWLATLPKLQVLLLRSNSFQSPIRNLNTRCPFPML
ncbi:receptor-like protein Cf-9 homolog [Pistacia vera]|uniref:receptor-like protein Cf-9 homolog n=1 Tax=Pistacia vera TaxID=55513 RepID=UPI00126344BA|nr:receptor-like protein Cf-9 homolog [Pistacia vera]